ncbi:MAG: EF-hand domain-containing protein [Gammaproteobacteria bacterium]|nr:EF-hand domain-containing protein [Gammaproteobacteria bacterium]
MKTLCIVSTGFCLSLSVMAATAAAPTFDGLDRNADGYISKDEAKAYKGMHKNWSKVDTNKDGRVNIDEFIKFESTGRFEPPQDAETPELGAAPM